MLNRRFLDGFDEIQAIVTGSHFEVMGIPLRGHRIRLLPLADIDHKPEFHFWFFYGVNTDNVFVPSYMDFLEMPLWL